MTNQNQSLPAVVVIDHQTGQVVQNANIRGVVFPTADLQTYADDVLREAQERLDERERKRLEAHEGIKAAIEAGEPHQESLWRSRWRRWNLQVHHALDYLNVIQAGYLPMPSLDAVALRTLIWRRGKQSRPLPVGALKALADAKKVPGFTEFMLADGKDNFGRARTRVHRDPILIGIADGEMFPIAWWRE